MISYPPVVMTPPETGLAAINGVIPPATPSPVKEWYGVPVIVPPPFIGMRALRARAVSARRDPETFKPFAFRRRLIVATDFFFTTRRVFLEPRRRRRPPVAFPPRLGSLKPPTPVGPPGAGAVPSTASQPPPGAPMGVFTWLPPNPYPIPPRIVRLRRRPPSTPPAVQPLPPFIE